MRICILPPVFHPVFPDFSRNCSCYTKEPASPFTAADGGLFRPGFGARMGAPFGLPRVLALVPTKKRVLSLWI